MANGASSPAIAVVEPGVQAPPAGCQCVRTLASGQLVMQRASCAGNLWLIKTLLWAGRRRRAGAAAGSD
jgi:hypothetical protein